MTARGFKYQPIDVNQDGASPQVGIACVPELDRSERFHDFIGHVLLPKLVRFQFVLFPLLWPFHLLHWQKKRRGKHFPLFVTVCIYGFTMIGSLLLGMGASSTTVGLLLMGLGLNLAATLGLICAGVALYLLVQTVLIMVVSPIAYVLDAFRSKVGEHQNRVSLHLRPSGLEIVGPCRNADGESVNGKELPWVSEAFGLEGAPLQVKVLSERSLVSTLVFSYQNQEVLRSLAVQLNADDAKLIESMLSDAAKSGVALHGEGQREVPKALQHLLGS